MSHNESIVEDAALTWFGGLGDAAGHGWHPSPAISRPFPAPTGHHAIAQGNALGIRPQTVPRPEGAQSGTGIRRDAFRGDGFRPFRAGNHFWDCTQGVALGYPILPRWGKNQGGVGSGGGRRIPNGCRVMFRLFPAPTGHHAIAQGNALGIRPPTVPRPEGAQPGTGIRRGVFHRDGFRPFRAGNHFWDCTQGDALGYRILPRWGRSRSDALGIRPKNNSKP